MSQHKLINFNAPRYLLKNFDNLAQHKSISRTSMLITLMERYVREEVDQMNKDNQLNTILCEMDERNRGSLGRRIKDSVKKAIQREREDTTPPSMMWDTNDAW